MQTELSAAIFICDSSFTYYAVFNNPSDANFVGYITDITGFDSSEVRENAQNTNAGDGGHHGAFWQGRRPFTVSGMIVPTTPAVARSAAQSKIDNVLNRCLLNDGYLAYEPSDSITRYINFRKQQPHRITSGQSPVQKLFQIAGVSRDWRFYTAGSPSSATFVNSGGTSSGNIGPLTQTNHDDALAPCVWTVTGPCDNIYITNLTTIEQIDISAMSLGTIGAGQTLTIDFTGQYPTAVRSDGTNLYGYINPTTTNFSIGSTPGANSWLLYGDNMTTATALTVAWNDAWN